MKKIKLLPCFFLARHSRILATAGLLTFPFSLCFGQQWLWGEQGQASIKGNDYGVSVVSDNSGNSYSCGSYSTDLTFQFITLHDTNDNGFMVKYDSRGQLIWAIEPISNSQTTSFYYSIARDRFNKLYVAGSFAGTIKLGTTTLISPHPSPNTVGGCVLLAKFDTNGTVIWAKQAVVPAGGASRGTAYGLTVDLNGNSYITGFFTDTITFGAYTLHAAAYAGNYYGNFFVVKYNTNGNVVWAKQSVVASPASYAVGNSVTTDNKGSIYVSGNYYDTVTIGATTLIQAPGIVYQSSFIAKYDTNGNVIWVKQPNPQNLLYTDCNAVVTDRAGNPYITGSFMGAVKFGRDSLGGILGLQYLYLMKYKKNGAEDWAVQSTGPGSSYPDGMSLAADTMGTIYLNGFTNGDSILFNTKMYTTPPAGFSTFIIDFDTAGNITCGGIERNTMSGISIAHDLGVASDSSGIYVYTTGSLDDSVFAGADTLIPFGNSNPFVLRWLHCGLETTDGTSELRAKNEELRVYPNPFSSSTTISIHNSLSTNHYLELYDLTGQKLKQMEFTGNTYTLSAEGLAKGMYFIRVFYKDKNVIGTSKLIVQ